MLFFEQYQIYKILSYYCENHKYADKDFVYKILDIIIKSRGYKHYVNQVEIDTKIDDNSMGKYNYIDKKISIKIPYLDYKVVTYNLTILSVILHECEHVKQFKKCNDKTKSIKKTLLKEDLARILFIKEQNIIDESKLSIQEIMAIRSKEMYYNKRKEIQDKMWEYLPAERMAVMDSYRYILNMLKKEKEVELCRGKTKFEKLYAISELMGYEKVDNKIICPTFYMYQKFDELSPDKKLFFQTMPILDSYSKKANLEERIYLGLPITQEEYDLKLEKLTKKKTKN